MEAKTFILPGGVPLTMVRLTAGFVCDEFWIAETPTTVAQWNAVTGETRAEQSDLPVTRVSFDDCLAFCTKLSTVTGHAFRLPFDREWCRAVGEEPTNLSDYAVFDVQEIAPVKSKKPNEYGLFDMRGNVWEWVARLKYKAGQTQYLRGGSWFFDHRSARSVFRGVDRPAYRSVGVGCRLVCVVRPPSPLATDRRVAPDVRELLRQARAEVAPNSAAESVMTLLLSHVNDLHKCVICDPCDEDLCNTNLMECACGCHAEADAARDTAMVTLLAADRAGFPRKQL